MSQVRQSPRYETDRVESGRYLRALAEHWPYILGSIGIAVVAALLFLGSAHKRYEADADVLVTPVPAGSLLGLPLFRESDLSRSVVTAARLVTSPQVLDGVNRRLHLREDRESLLGHVSVTPQEQSSVLTITGKASSPRDAARLANAFVEVLLAERAAQLHREAGSVIATLTQEIAKTRAAGGGAAQTAPLAARLGSLRTVAEGPDPSLQELSQAVPPDMSVWPRPVLTLAVAVIAGLLLGMAIAVMLELVNPLVLDESEIVGASPVPVLARLPRPPTSLARARGDVVGPVVSQFRVLWANLLARCRDRRPKIVLVTGVGPKESRIYTAVGLGAAIARSGRRVALVEADLADPTLARALHAEPSAFEEALLGTRTAQDALATVPRSEDRLQLLATSDGDAGVADLIAPDRLATLARELARSVDVVVVDAPPPREAPDFLLLSSAADAVVLVVSLRRTRRDELAELRRELEQWSVPVTGFGVVGRRRARGGSTARAPESPRARTIAIAPDAESEPTKRPASRAANPRRRSAGRGRAPGGPGGATARTDG
jgi:succinoglycan biosynthesis transport protein ExoP